VTDEISLFMVDLFRPLVEQQLYSQTLHV